MPQATFTWPVRVYYEDTDAAGVVYYANYLKFMERARTEWLRALGFEQNALRRDHHVVFVVRNLEVEYLQPAVFDDALDITVAVTGVRGSVLQFAQSVRCGQRDLAAGRVGVACVNTRTFKPVRIPKFLLEKLAMRQA